MSEEIVKEEAVAEQEATAVEAEEKEEVVKEKPAKKKAGRKKDWFDKEGKELVAKGVGIKKFVQIAIRAYGHEADYATVVSELKLQDLIRKGDHQGICKKLKVK